MQYSYPGQPAPGQYPPMAGYGMAPGAYGQPMPGQPMPAQPMPGAYPAQPMPAQPMPGAYPAQPMPGAYPPQPMPGAYPPQPMPGAYPPQPMPGAMPAAAPMVAPMMGAAVAGYDPATDARRLLEAMRGLGTNDSVLIDIIGHRTREQRMMIVAEYQRSIRRDLLKDLESETSGNYRRVLLLLMKPRDEMFAELLNMSMKGAGTKDNALIDIMTQFPYELPAISVAYQRKYGKSLESAIKSETSGNYEKFLCALLNTHIPPPGMVDPGRAMADAETFYRAGEGRLGTDERTYITIMSSNNREQLRLIDENYRRTHSKGMEHAIKSETSGNFRDAMLACITPPDMYFATRVKDAVDGAGTKDTDLILAFVANERPQLQMIAQAYQRRYGKSMAKRVSDDVSGDYKKILMALL